MIYDYNLETHSMNKLINNYENHWNEDIHMLSQLVISKLLNYDKNLINLLDEKKQKILQSMNFSAIDDGLWEYKFDLKAD
jgi:hypothetical protein